MPEDIDHIPIGHQSVGIVGLKTILQKAVALAIEDKGQLKAALLRLAREDNYIPPDARQSYAQGLLSAYSRYVGQESQNEAAGLIVRILGQGCPNCRRLTQLAVNALAELELTADLEHVTDPDKIARYGLVGVPALVINGRICSSGRVPTKEKIKRWLKESG